MNNTLDSDINAMKLSDGEKWGLQVYRNYSRAFGEKTMKTMGSGLTFHINTKEKDTKRKVCPQVHVIFGSDCPGNARTIWLMLGFGF